ncbi:uncharacterized protein LODBEIA_P14470 [Lodderomyces beijingensis]|uniref:Uncharacterized protein n=1 Tax=Lodderomyces beijingensis TaxID=1775926 RepID=A0ABP0ZGC5_9ASCO
MNVTSNGYYSEQYLNRRKQQLLEAQRYHYDQSYYAPTPQELLRADRMNSGLESPHVVYEMPQRKQPIMKNIRPKPRVPSSSGSPNSARNGNDVEDQVEYYSDDDELKEEQTPAQLNYIQNQQQQQRRQHRYRNQRHYLLQPGQPIYPYDQYGYMQQPASRQPKIRPNKNDNYYLKQKEKFDAADASLKPKMYTHNTFREVFQDKDENINRYNPMDSVFEKKRVDSDGKDIKTTFLRNVRFMKESYHDYDYYDSRKKKKSNSVKDVFVTQVSDDDDDDDDDENNDVEQEGNQDAANGKSVSEDGGEGGAKKKAKNTKFKVMLRKKLKKTSKELGRNFDSHLEERRQLKAQAMKEEEEAKAKAEKLEQERIQETQFGTSLGTAAAAAGGIGGMVAPLANYLWSWMPSYPQQATNVDQNQVLAGEAIPPVVKTKFDEASPLSNALVVAAGAGTRAEDGGTTIKAKKNPRLKKFASGSKTLFANWNQPANKMFNGELMAMADASKLQKTKPTRDTPTAVDITSSATTTAQTEAAPNEFVIEYDSDNDEGKSMSEELYYNPQTRQLEMQPPTSQSSMLLASKPKPMLLDAQVPMELISNFILVLKRVQIMKLIFAPIDIIGEFFPHLQTVVIILELVLFVWILFELSRLIDALCMMVKAFCAPMIAVGRFMNKIM